MLELDSGAGTRRGSDARRGRRSAGHPRRGHPGRASHSPGSARVLLPAVLVDDPLEGQLADRVHEPRPPDRPSLPPDVPGDLAQLAGRRAAGSGSSARMTDDARSKHSCAAFSVRS